MVCRGVHASRSKSLQHRNKGQHSSFIPFPSRAADTHDSSMVQISSVPTTRLEGPPLCIPLSISIKNQDTCIRTWTGFQSHVWRNDSTKLILTWEAVKVMITWLSFSCHGFVSTVGALTAAFLYGKKQIFVENFMQNFILETVSG